MKTVLVTGSDGFIGKNLCAALAQDKELNIIKFTRQNTTNDLEEYVKKADFIYHTAGVNRPESDKEFETDNTDLTKTILKYLSKHNKNTPLLITSSAQSTLNNPYGISKKNAEAAVFEWVKISNAKVFVYRLPGVFGKWCKPNYNSVVATFCHNIANELPVTMSDPSHELNLVYIDEVIASFIDTMNGNVSPGSDGFCTIPNNYTITLQQLKDTIESFKNSRKTLVMPDLEDKLNKYLYATFTSYLPTDKFSYELTKNSDDRGWLTEFIKSNQFGQIFISKTKPGVTRGEHWHNTKIEKFFVIEGDAEILFRKIGDTSDKKIRYKVSGKDLTPVDIPAGYVHSIKNIGKSNLLTIFWADEILDKNNPDTYYEKV